MTPAIIIVLVMAAFVIARLFRSTKMWWKLLFAIMTGLLVGMLSKGLTGSKHPVKPVTELISTINNADPLMCMQSLVATVTEGTTVCQSGVAGHIIKDEVLFDALISKHTGTNGRNPPAIQNDS